jgi:hypothetical protein
MTRRAALVVALIAVFFLAACGEDNPAPTGDPPILNSFDSMPKQIATIVLTPTPTLVIAGAEVVVVEQPTSTPGPPRPTATLTPYVGVFLGQPTSESGQPVPTLAPYVINPVSGGPVVASGGIGPASGGACSIPVAASFANAYNGSPTVQQRLGCPVNGGAPVSMVTQPFERGNMYWRSDTRQIYALANSGQFWQVADSWTEGMPADDPGLSVPGGLLQPVRGFGLAWRSNQAIRDAVGWGALPEAQYSGYWQDFERGAMFVGSSSLIYALFPAEGQHSGPLSP